MRPVLAFLAAAFLATPALAAEKSIAIGYVPAFKGLDAIVERDLGGGWPVPWAVEPAHQAALRPRPPVL